MWVAASHWFQASGRVVCCNKVWSARSDGALQAIVTFNRLDDLAHITVPTLCLAGEHDRNAAPHVMQRMAERIVQGQYQCLAGVGHLANMEQPQAFNRAVLDFLLAQFPV